MATFDVARTTIRDAFRVLETEGLLEVRRGGGEARECHRISPPERTHSRLLMPLLN